MKTIQSRLLIAAVAVAAGACSGNHLLVGEGPDAGSPTGTAGAGAASAGGGTAGAVGTTQLQISGLDAITRIAAVLWNAPPDGDVLVQATQGHFTKASDLDAAVHEMLADPRAATGVGKFYRWWLNLDFIYGATKDPTLFPSYTPALQTALSQETETFGVQVTLALNGTYQMLMTAPFSFLDAQLAELYGVSGVTGDDLRQVGLDPTERAGIVTQGALQSLSSLATRNDPSKRGTYMNEHFFCLNVPAPPAGIPPLASPAPGVTLRKALAADVAQPVCEACHAELDPPGLAFETYDAIGRWRTTDNGAPVDVSALQIDSIGNVATATVSGPIELANLLATTDSSQECMARQWIAFALGKKVDELDDAMVKNVKEAFAASHYNLQALIVAVLTSETFLAL